MEQDVHEHRWLLEHMRGFESVLEIGSRGGASLRSFALACPRGARIRSIDVCDSHELRACIRELRQAGYDADAFIGDSMSAAAIEFARDDGPYDFIFIDGDHAYEPVKADWENYGPMGTLVGFHDIAGETGVRVLWQEIKLTRKTAEFSASYMGTGIVFNAEPALAAAPLSLAG